MKRGKAAGLDGVTTEHLQYCHAILPCVLSKLFNLMIRVGHVPAGFGQSYTVPVLKSSGIRYSKMLDANDYRGVSISPVISKVFEHCVLERYSDYFVTSCNQFGFKKGSSCTQAIYTLKCAVNYYISRGSTVNICALDLSKAFDKMNHCGLFIKLMRRRIPVQLLSLLEYWFSLGVTCVKWGTIMSANFTLSCGIRQGGVLSPYLFAVYVDGLVDKVQNCGSGCFVNWVCCGIILYADDILLLSPSVTSLQELLRVCEVELQWLDMQINVRKSVCMRIGPRFNATCRSLYTVDGNELRWSDSIRYLGVYLTSSRVLSCSLKYAKRSFYRAFNGIFGKVGSIASETVVIELLKSKCMPILFYGLEVCPLNKSHIKSIDYALNSCLKKIFSTNSQEVISECRDMFHCLPAEDVIAKRKKKFLLRFVNSDNLLCNVFHNIANEDLAALAN